MRKVSNALIITATTLATLSGVWAYLYISLFKTKSLAVFIGAVTNTMFFNPPSHIFMNANWGPSILTALALVALIAARFAGKRENGVADMLAA